MHRPNEMGRDQNGIKYLQIFGDNEKNICQKTSLFLIDHQS